MMQETGFQIDTDSDQGTAVYLLDAQEKYEAADLLEFAGLTYDIDTSDYDGPDSYRVDLEVEIALLPRYTEAVCESIVEALEVVQRPAYIRFRGWTVYPKRVDGDWRDLRRQGRLTGINNQATRMPLPKAHPRKYGLNFRDASEVAVFDAFERAQKRLPDESTLLAAPNAVVFVGGKTREVDLIVTYRGRAGVVEVDGSTHHKRYAADQSRDRELLDAGIQLVDRIVAEDTNDPAALDKFVERFLQRLTR